MPTPFTASDGAGRVRVARGLGRLDVLQRADQVEEPHRHDHREVGEPRSLRRQRVDQVAEHRHRRMEGERRRRCGAGPARCPVSQANAVPSATATRPPGSPPLEPDPAEVDQQHDRQRAEADDRPREGAEEEADGDEARGRCRPASTSSAARGVDLGGRARRQCAASSSMSPGAEAGHQARVPRHLRRVRRARRLRGQLGRQHDQEDVGEQRDGVDAVGQRADVVAAGARARAASPARRRRGCRPAATPRRPGRMRP